MDVYHKVLSKIYEEAGGKETVEVDLNDLLKREGFFSNIQGITAHLTGESWVTETARKYVVKITHWGVAEAKRVKADLPDRNQVVSKDANRLLAETREFVIMLEEFAGDPSPDKFGNVQKRFGEIDAIVKRLASTV